MIWSTLDSNWDRGTHHSLCGALYCPSSLCTQIPNFTGTGGSSTSETVVQAALNACKEMNIRLAPYKKEGMEWKDVVAAAASDCVCLSVEVIRVH